jgi:hypothetical protein
MPGLLPGADGHSLGPMGVLEDTKLYVDDGTVANAVGVTGRGVRSGNTKGTVGLLRGRVGGVGSDPFCFLTEKKRMECTAAVSEQ